MNKLTLQEILDKIDEAIIQLVQAADLAHASEDRREVQIRRTISALAALYHSVKGSK